MAKFYEQREITPEGYIAIYIMLELGKYILVLNIMNKFDTVLIKITRFRDSTS